MISERHFPGASNPFLTYQVLESTHREAVLFDLPVQPVKKLIGYGPTRKSAWRMARLDPDKLATPLIPEQCLPVEPVQPAGPSNYSRARKVILGMAIGETRGAPDSLYQSMGMASRREGIRLKTRKNGDGTISVTRIQ